jgi:4-diphosphocytidyl-2-C-methyl-D-erythritol kinase
MNSLMLESPAKVNLMLSVHGPRGDGFHALTSLVVALDFGDTLRVTRNDVGVDRLHCSDPTVPSDESNLILKAAAAFCARFGESVTFDFDLNKRIPMGAGLGGGSSNAAVALRAMNQLTGERLEHATLLQVAAELGSDCPFFIDAVPSIMSGRGEVLAPLARETADALRGQRILLFRPFFSVPTAWAYRRLLDSQPSAYETEAQATARLRQFDASGDVAGLLYNTFEPSVGSKYLAIPCLLERLRAAGHACLMSGSGSCCFALPKDAHEAATISELIKKDWGSRIFFVETSIS